MKKLFILSFLICLISYGVFAQDATVKRTEEYCEFKMVSPLLSKRLEAHVDFGKGYEALKNEQGKPMDFPSAVAALNYMNSQGWELINVHVWMNDGDGSSYYVMKRKL